MILLYIAVPFRKYASLLCCVMVETKRDES